MTTSPAGHVLAEQTSPSNGINEKVGAFVEKPQNATATNGVSDESPVVAAAREKERKTGKRYTLFDVPSPTSKPVPATEPTAEQKEKYATVLKHFQALEKLPVDSTKGAKYAPLADHEKMFITKECIERFLRATKWDVQHAIKRLENTLVWRREYGTEAIGKDYIEIESETGKQWIIGYDIHGRPCHTLNPARQNTEPSPRQIQHLVYMLERAIDLMPPGQSTLALLIDFKESSTKKNPSLATGRTALNILQNHYPERLGKALVVNIPWFVWGFLKLINPFIDPLTREKIVYDEPLDRYVPREQLEKRFGGDLDFEYDHSVYWTHLHEICGRKRDAYAKRWRERGCRIGDSEFILKGGEDPDVPDVGKSKV